MKHSNQEIAFKEELKKKKKYEMCIQNLQAVKITSPSSVD